MLRLTIVSPALGANCYVLAPEGGPHGVIVDPGYGVADKVNGALAEYRVSPTAILITHGHIDHIASVPALAVHHNIPVYIHESDAHRLVDPVATLSPDLSKMLASLADGWQMPPAVRHIGTSSPVLALADLAINPIPSPGHTEGSTLYHVPDAEGDDVLVTGDVLFAGTIGRTDLPGGDPAAMTQTLRRLATPPADGGLADNTVVLPGHGEPSHLGRERASNPYL